MQIQIRAPREPLNCYTHAIPALMTIPAVALLLLHADTHIECTAATVYGLSAFILFSISAIYHSVPQTPQEIRFWQKCDHCCIYLMIAGSYTPTALLVLDGWTRWALFSIVWIVAIIGCILKIKDRLQQTGLSLTIYLAMGMLILPFIPQLKDKLSVDAFAWIIIGGGFYVFGTIFYYKDKEINKYLHTHEVWHLFGVAGAAAHYVYNYKYLFVG